MKKTNFLITLTLRGGKKETLTFHTEAERKTRFEQLAQSSLANSEVANIVCSEDVIDEENFVFDIALISSIISGEYYRSLAIKTILSQVEVSKLIATVAIDVYREVKSKYPKVLDPAAPQDPLLLQVTDLAKKMIWEKHNIKL